MDPDDKCYCEYYPYDGDYDNACEHHKKLVDDYIEEMINDDKSPDDNV
jgi:hypothetical protein